MKATPAILLTALLSVSTLPVWSHGDEDHGAEAAKPAVQIVGDKPARLPDGRVLLPKSTQRRLAVRTVLAAEQSVPRSIELNGHVVMDPNAGGRIQSMQAGRIEAGPQGLPLPGAKVRKGQVLAYIKPALGSVERAGQQAELADLKTKTALAEKQLTRLRALQGSVSKKEIESAESALDALRRRKAAIGGAGAAEALIAPASGVVASARVVVGQVVDAREVLFEIVDPARLLVEALAYDPKLVGALRGASLAGSQTQLVYLGGASSLREGALPLLFRPNIKAKAPDMPLALGQAVQVIAQTEDTIKGTPVPAASVVRNSANETVVWVHDSAEIFRSVPVQVSALDGTNVLAIGLKPGQRVVVSGATLINQIR